MKLEGTWYNQLGSKMTLQVVQGAVTGTYETAVGSASGEYTVAGRTDTDNDSSRNVGFVVSWENGNGSSDSVTAWSGQLQEIDGQETLRTFWLLTIETKPDTNWKSTLVGNDTFTRNPPSEEHAQKAMRGGPCSHPL